MSTNWTRVVRWLGIDLSDQEMLNSKPALRKVIKINPVTQQNPERPRTWGPRYIWGGGEGGTENGKIVGKLMNSKSYRTQAATLPDCSRRWKVGTASLLMGNNELWGHTNTHTHLLILLGSPDVASHAYIPKQEIEWLSLGELNGQKEKMFRY